jgi:hypothetical protein
MKNNVIIAFSALILFASSAMAEDIAIPAPASAPELPAPTPPAAPTAASNAMIPPPAQMPAPAPAIPLAKKVELMDGAWALVDGDTVKISTDNGENWTKAPDQTWVAKDGSKLATKNGKIAK